MSYLKSPLKSHYISALDAIQKHKYAILRTLLVELFIIFICLAYTVYWADSEIWSIHLSYYFSQDFLAPWVSTKPLFHAMLWFIQVAPNDSWINLHLARTFFIFISALILLLTYRLCKQYSKHPIIPILCCFLLLSNTGFLNQGFRIRSDQLATLICLFIWDRSLKNNKFNFYYFFLPILATPKAVVLLPFLYLVSRSINTPYKFSIPSLWEKIINSTIFGSKKLYLISLGSFIVIFSYFAHLNYKYVVNYLLQSLGEHFGSRAYLSYESFLHLNNQILRNFVFWLLFLFSITLRILNRKTQKIFPQDLVLLAYLILLFVLFPEKTQFFIASLLPFFIIFLIPLFNNMIKIRSNGIKIVCTTCLVLFLCIKSHFWALQNIKENNNFAQIQTIKNLQEWAQHNHILSHYDIIGLLAQYSKSRLFAGPNDPQGNAESLNQLIKEKPDSIHLVNKSVFLKPNLDQFLNLEYVSLEPRLYLRNKYKLAISSHQSERLNSNHLRDILPSETNAFLRESELIDQKTLSNFLDNQSFVESPIVRDNFAYDTRF